MATEEAELLARAQRGDSAAMDVLLARHERGIYRFGLRMCGSEEKAKEVLQYTLLAAFQHLGGFKGEAKLSTWLYQIARSYCHKANRRRSDDAEAHVSVDEGEGLELQSERANPEELIHARELGDALQAAIRALPTTYREALVLRDVEGLTAEEAAQVLGLEVANLKSRLHRARLELRKSLALLLEPAEWGEAAPPCPALARELTSYLDDDIDKATCERLEAHLSTCPSCSAACDALHKTVSLCQRIPGDQVPDSVRQAVKRALHQATVTA